MFGFSTLKLIGLGVGALALLAAFLWVKDAFDDRAELRVWQDEVATATREASANPKLATDQVALQIQLLGKSVAECKTSLARQNEAIDRMALITKRSQNTAVQALERAAERTQGIEGVIAGLNRSATGPRDACKPSAALTEAWR